MIYVKPMSAYACEIVTETEEGAVALSYADREAFEDALGHTKKFEGNAWVDMTAEEIAARNAYRLRGRRKPLLAAFDKWEKAVVRGRESDDPAVMRWYRMTLDLDPAAFENIPERIRYYLG